MTSGGAEPGIAEYYYTDIRFIPGRCSLHYNSKESLIE